MNILLLFLSSYVTVLLLVIQSINNNHGRAMASCVTSIGIGVAQVALYKIVPSASFPEIVAFIAGGPLANVTAQWVKRSDISIIKRLHQ